MAERSLAKPMRGKARPAAAAAPSASEPPAPAIWDVWSRPGAKYRVRAVVLLVVNVVLFAGLGVFAFWLRTGQHFAPTMEDYWGLFWKTFQPAGEDRIVLRDLLTFPISIYDVPLQIVILGLLLAALVSIPIVVSILYRFAACIPFLLIVAFLAMMPWLAITLAGSCLLASVKPFRFSFRFASALLGLVLVIIYFYSASRQSAEAVQILVRPSDRFKFMAPWVLAIIASCVICGLVLLIARTVNYRPGAIAPLMAALFAVPIVLFEAYVGRDELHYRLLEHQFGPTSAYFADQDVSKKFEHSIYERWRAHPPPKPSYEVLAEQQEFRWNLELEEERHRRSVFAQHRDAAVQACDEFLFHFPVSRYAPCALYIKALALDTRIDLSAFRAEKAIRFYSSFPSDASRHAWEKIVANVSTSPVTAVARLRLAQLDTREHNVDRAVERLTALLDTFGRGPRAASQPAGRAGGIGNVFTSRPPESSLEVPLDSTVFEARRWLDILQSNRDPLYGYDPLCGPKESGPDRVPFGWAQLDPRDLHYVANLEALLTAYPKCQLADNIELELAKAGPDLPTRIRLLRACVEKDPHGDALPEALFRLGVAYQEAGRPSEARPVLQRLAAEFAESIWKPAAVGRLRSLPVETTAS